MHSFFEFHFSIPLMCTFFVYIPPAFSLARTLSHACLLDLFVYLPQSLCHFRNFPNSHGFLCLMRSSCLSVNFSLSPYPRIIPLSLTPHTYTSIFTCVHVYTSTYIYNTNTHTNIRALCVSSFSFLVFIPYSLSNSLPLPHTLTTTLFLDNTASANARTYTNTHTHTHTRRACSQRTLPSVVLSCFASLHAPRPPPYTKNCISSRVHGISRSGIYPVLHNPSLFCITLQKHYISIYYTIHVY